MTGALTFPCSEYPLKAHFYILKEGFAGIYLFFLFLIRNIDSGFSTLNVLSKYIKNIFFSPMKFSIIIAEKVPYLLHGQAFVMSQ